MLREQRKNVHAGVVGTLQAWAPYSPAGRRLQGEPVALMDPSVFDQDNVDPRNASPWAWGITYNPYKGPTFTRVTDGQPVELSRTVWAVDRRVTAILGERCTA